MLNEPAQEPVQAPETKFTEPAVREHNGRPIYSQRHVARIHPSRVTTDGVTVFVRERLSDAGFFEEKASD